MGDVLDDLRQVAEWLDDEGRREAVRRIHAAADEIERLRAMIDTVNGQRKRAVECLERIANLCGDPDVEDPSVSVAALVADLARVTGERDRAEAMHLDFREHVNGLLPRKSSVTIMGAIQELRDRAEAAELERVDAERRAEMYRADRDHHLGQAQHWRSVAESRPEITAEDAARFGRWLFVDDRSNLTIEDQHGYDRVCDALLAHEDKAAKAEVKS